MLTVRAGFTPARPRSRFRLLGSQRRLVAFAIFLALHRGVAIDQLDDGARSAVAVAETGLQDAGVAASAVLVTRGQDVEELLDLILVAQARSGKTPGVQITALG